MRFDDQTQLDPQGRKLFFEDILLNALEDFSFPIIKSYEFGHRCPSTFLPIGGLVGFDTEAGCIAVEESFLQ